MDPDALRPPILTSDGEQMYWPHSVARTTLLTKAHLLRLRSRDALERVLAHEKLTSTEIYRLYGTRNKRRRARELRLCARRIRACEEQGKPLEKHCRGIAERALIRLFRASRDPDQLLRFVLAEPVANFPED